MRTLVRQGAKAECGHGLVAKGPVQFGRWSTRGILGHGTGLGIQGLEKQAEWSHQQHIWAQDSGLDLVFRSFPLGVAQHWHQV